MATANDFAVANSYLPPQKPVLGQNELAVWELPINLQNFTQKDLSKMKIFKKVLGGYLFLKHPVA